MRKKAFFILILSIIIILENGCNSNPKNKTGRARTFTNKITIAAASDLKYAMDSLVNTFQSIHPGIGVDVIYGSSGKFYQQVIRDAPYDLYFSADAEYPAKLATSGLSASDPKIYAIGRIVIYSTMVDTKKGMITLSDNFIRKIAIANPSHAPYGKRAEEALRYYMLYDKLKHKLIMGENIAQAAQYVSSGAAEAGIIAQSLALSHSLQRQGNYYLIPEKSHSRLQQSFIILKRAEKNPAAYTFSKYISSPEAKQILKNYGFSIPE